LIGARAAIVKARPLILPPHAGTKAAFMTPDLSNLPYLDGASPDTIAFAEAEAEWFSLPGGKALFGVTDDPDGVYFVLSGTLAAFRQSSLGDHRLLGYIRPGEPVGEMAFISEGAHTASVYAIRDLELVKFSRAAFDRLVQMHPAMLMRLARLMLRRSQATPARRPRSEPRVYALIGTSPTIDLELRAKTLVNHLAKMGKVACAVGEDSQDMLSSWFDALEQDHDSVFLFASIGDIRWFRTCLRQADRIWILARADAVPSIPLLPEEDPSPARQFKLVDVVLLHHGADREAASAEQWRRACDAQRIFHWQGLDDNDAARLARVICARAVGLVLSGGGARAYAHLGVIRALREAKIPIDMAGGTSMGAIVAACYAKGWDDNEIETRIRKAFVETNPLGDYVLPVLALSRGRRVETRIAENFGDTLIEDLLLPFFCVSTDLVNGVSKVHRAGRLAPALRATISLPGILPPVVTDTNELLVDGAVLKNFPVDVMRQLHRGPIIGVDVARRNTIDPNQFVNVPDFISWVTTRGFQSAPPIGALLMHTATLSIDPWEGRDATDILITPDIPDVSLRDWKMFDEAVAAGYEAAVAALKRQPVDLPKPDPYQAGAAESEEEEEAMEEEPVPALDPALLAQLTTPDKV
jgi:NTE family protein